MKQKLTLVINLSLRSIRVILFTRSGEKIYENWLPIRTYINDLKVEQDPGEWWRLLKELLIGLPNEIRERGIIEAVTVTSSALCLVCIDKDGNELDKAYMVSDKRAIMESDLMQAKADSLAVKSFKVDASYMFPKILWIKKHKPKLFANVSKFLSSNDFLIAKLSGKYMSDSLNAEKFYFDIKKKIYPKLLLDQLDITSTRFPRVVEPGELVGSVKTEIAKEFPFLSNTSVYISTYDAVCALLGSSTYDEGELNNVCGTCSSYRILTEKAQTLPSRLLEQQLPSENMRIIGGSNNLEGGVLEWAKECYYSDVFPKDDAGLYLLMEQEASESTLGANGLLFIPYLIGERMPMNDAYVRGIFFGMERFHTRKDILRSIFEATAFQAKMMLEEFERNGIEIAKVNMSGGVAKLSLAAQIRADVLGIPVHVLSEVETTALGAFILTQKGMGRLKSVREGKKFIGIRKTYLPNMHNHNCYASLYMLYKELYTTNSPLFKKRHEIYQDLMQYQKKVLENL